MAFTPDQYNELERAVARGLRIVVTRRGSPWVVVAERLDVKGAQEVLVARRPSTREVITFDVREIEHLEIVR